MVQITESSPVLCYYFQKMGGGGRFGKETECLETTQVTEFIYLFILAIKPRTSHMLGKGSATEPHPKTLKLKMN